MKYNPVHVMLYFRLVLAERAYVLNIPSALVEERNALEQRRKPRTRNRRNSATL